MTKEDFVVKLADIGAIKFGSFTLKSGIVSPFYINLRDVVSSPELLEAASRLVEDECKAEYDVVSGVPYTALPIASLVSAHSGKGLIFKRKEEKAYGLKDSIVGTYKPGDRCFLIEDLITTGESILENAVALQEAGIEIVHISMIIDRSFDNAASLREAGFSFSSIVTLKEMIAILQKRGKIGADEVEAIEKFVAENSGDKKALKHIIKNPVTNKILSVIKEKETNLTLSLDVTESDQFFSILEKTADKIAVLKTHIDIIDDFTPKFIDELIAFKKKYNFVIFEDRKFADIGNTVRHQFRNGVYKIADWADIVTVHMVPGPGILEGLFGGIENRSGLLLARMSSKGNYINEDYTRRVIAAGIENEMCVSGFIGHGNDAADIKKFRNKIPSNFLFFMPGVKIDTASDGLGQSYITPDVAVKNGADLIIVGRGIVAADDPSSEAEKYRKTAYREYQKRVK
ncbi:MAG: orotidine-5'-phosphate decarboxylase [Spirochaetes bacterium]|jgi:uridine monophosphate synthetase|nr:orotidine-5'-phosphate decarboxylase [Spirochaetota bacterium]